MRPAEQGQRITFEILHKKLIYKEVTITMGGKGEEPGRTKRGARNLSLKWATTSITGTNFAQGFRTISEAR